MTRPNLQVMHEYTRIQEYNLIGIDIKSIHIQIKEIEDHALALAAGPSPAPKHCATLMLTAMPVPNGNCRMKFMKCDL